MIELIPTIDPAKARFIQHDHNNDKKYFSKKIIFFKLKTTFDILIHNRQRAFDKQFAFKLYEGLHSVLIIFLP